MLSSLNLLHPSSTLPHQELDILSLGSPDAIWSQELGRRTCLFFPSQDLAGLLFLSQEQHGDSPN